MAAYATILISAAVLSFLLAFPIRSVALAFGVVDHPERRKMHQIPIPRLGGLAIFLSFGVVSGLAVMVGGFTPTPSPAAYAGLMAGALIIVGLGIWDDVKGLKAAWKFAGQTLAALVVVAFGGRVEAFTNPLGDSFHLGWLGIPLAVLWIVGVTNAVNLIDGLDGLAAGITGIAAFGLFAIAVPDQPFVAALAICLAGTVLGFLKHNFYPARIFLGDTGSMLLGFTLAVLGLHGSFKATTATVLYLPLIVLGVPIFDTAFAILRRAKRRISPFRADREHIHHRLVRIGLHHRNVVLVMYFISAYLAVTAYSIAQLPYQSALLFVVLLTLGGTIGLRTIQFIEDRLEAKVRTAGIAVVAPEASNGIDGSTTDASRDGGARRKAFSSLVCEVAGFRDGFGDPIELESLRNDLRNLLSRRVKVHSVLAEPVAPRHVMLILLMEPIDPPMVALAKNGITWYLEDHRERLSDDQAFPSIYWIRTNPSAPPADPSSREAGGRVGAEVVPIRQERASALGS